MFSTFWLKNLGHMCQFTENIFGPSHKQNHFRTEYKMRINNYSNSPINYKINVKKLTGMICLSVDMER